MNILTEKAGPLPLWGWLGIATVGALLFASKGKGSSSSQAAAQQAAAQQQLTAQQAQLAATAAANSPNSAANTGSGTYGSGGGSYSGNGNTGQAAGGYQTRPVSSAAGGSSAMYTGTWAGHGFNP